MKLSRFLPTVVLGLLAVLSSIPGGPGGGAVAQDVQMDRLRMQLRDCAGPSCVAQRNQLITRLRARTQDCSGFECDRLRAGLRDQQRLRGCDAAGGNCAAQRQHVRQREHRMYLMPEPRAPGGGGMGGRR